MKDREAWRAAVHGVKGSRTRLSEGATAVFTAVLLDDYTTVLIHSPADGHLGFSSY